MDNKIIREVWSGDKVLQIVLDKSNITGYIRILDGEANIWTEFQIPVLEANKELHRFKEMLRDILDWLGERGEE